MAQRKQLDNMALNRRNNMKNNNICRFVAPKYTQNLSALCFVWECDSEIMKRAVVLQSHRIVLCIKDGATAHIDSREFEITPGTLLFAFKGEEIWTDADEGCELMYIQFEGDRSSELFKRFNIYENNRVFHGFDSLVPMWKESISRANEETADLVSESLIYYSFSRLTPANIAKDGLFHKIVAIVEEHFNDSRLSLEMIADELSYNSKYISTIFKKEMGVGFSKYLKTVRMKYAVSLFDHGINSVKNVAFLSGYTDPMYFSNVFKNEIGVSPKEYINSVDKS